MTEAFEIGVSLALQDGVSEAIGRARRDVAALEHAVRESGVSIRILRDAGVKAASVAFGDRPRAAAGEAAQRVVQDAAPAVERAAGTAPHAVLLGAVQRAPRDVGTQAAFASTREPDDRGSDVAAALMPDAAPSPPVRDGFFPGGAAPVAGVDGPEDGAAPVQVPREPVWRAGRAEEVAAAPVGASVAAQGPLQAAAPQAPPALVALPVYAGAPFLGQQEGAADVPTMPDAVSLRDQDAQGEDRHVSLLSALGFSGGAASVAQVDEPAAGGEDAGDADMRQAPVFGPRTYGAAPPMGAATTGAQAQTAPRQAEAREAGPHGGDVFLDGMLVGRWMSKFLNREAERASAGPTGFDARRGRLLPGVTVGG